MIFPPRLTQPDPTIYMCYIYIYICFFSLVKCKPLGERERESGRARESGRESGRAREWERDRVRESRRAKE